MVAKVVETNIRSRLEWFARLLTYEERTVVLAEEEAERIHIHGAQQGTVDNLFSQSPKWDLE